MRYHALATDYDGTIATQGALDEVTAEALDRLRASGRKLLLVTGRQINELEMVCPRLARFDAIVAENGALLYRPASREIRMLAAPPPAGFVRALRSRGVAPIAVGQVIVATRTPHEKTVLEVIRSMGLELNMIFNKGAVMVLPPGVNKATGLWAALSELGFSPHNVVAVGDAENDHAFLAGCECGVAVANALDSLKTRADWVTAGDHGNGVSELIDALLRDDLAHVAPRLGRHDIPIGKDELDRLVDLPAYGASMLVTGSSGGRSPIVTGLVQRMVDLEYQQCIVDPTGRWAHCGGAVVLASAIGAPAVDEVLNVLTAPARNVVVNLIGLLPSQWPLYMGALLPRLLELRARYGRPHWIVLEEAASLLPVGWQDAALTLPARLTGMLLATAHPGGLAPAALLAVDHILATGSDAGTALNQLATMRGERVDVHATLTPGESLLWRAGAVGTAIKVRTISSLTTRVPGAAREDRGLPGTGD